MRVAIKSIDSDKYAEASFNNQISEGNAMLLCQRSHQVVLFVEEFKLQGKTYIVTKLAPGGDLLRYLSDLGVDRLPEERACKIFT